MQHSPRPPLTLPPSQQKHERTGLFSPAWSWGGSVLGGGDAAGAAVPGAASGPRAGPGELPPRSSQNRPRVLPVVSYRCQRHETSRAVELPPPPSLS